MKTTFSFMLLMIVAMTSVSAKEATHKKKTAIPKDKKMQVVDVESTEKKADAPCETDAKELMKKLEDEQKKKAAKGQAFSLQGNNASGGCTIGN